MRIQLLLILGHSCIMSPRPSVDHFDFVAQGSAIRQTIHDSAFATRVFADVTEAYDERVRWENTIVQDVLLISKLFAGALCVSKQASSLGVLTALYNCTSVAIVRACSSPLQGHNCEPAWSVRTAQDPIWEICPLSLLS